MRQTLTADFSDAIKAVAATGLFVSLCSIGKPPQTLNESGQVDLTNYTPVTGLQNIPCMMAPLRIGQPDREGEIRGDVYIAQQAQFHVLLNGVYAGIEQKMQATVDGVALDILAVENDSQKTMTRLAVRRYEI